MDAGVNRPVGDPDSGKLDDDYQVQVLGLVTSIDWGSVNGTGNPFGNGNDRIVAGLRRWRPAMFPLGLVGAWRQEPVTYGMTAKVKF